MSHCGGRATVTAKRSSTRSSQWTTCTDGSRRASLLLRGTAASTAHARSRQELNRSDLAVLLYVLKELFQHLGHIELAADALRQSPDPTPP